MTWLQFICVRTYAISVPKASRENFPSWIVFQEEIASNNRAGARQTGCLLDKKPDDQAQSGSPIVSPPPMAKQKSRSDFSGRLCCSGAVSAPEISATVIDRRYNLFLLAASAGLAQSSLSSARSFSTWRSRSRRLPAQVAARTRSTSSAAHASSSTCSLMNQCINTWAG